MSIALFTYILQVNLLLALVYIGYYLFLKKLTFYRLNRLYLLLGSVYALLYPFLDLRAFFAVDNSGMVSAITADIDSITLGSIAGASVWTLEHLFFFLFAVGAFVVGIRFMIQLLSICRIHLFSHSDSWQSYPFRQVSFSIVPFSFLKHIYLNKESHNELALHHIFKHENIHVKGLHTVDILFFEMLLVGCWYNPFVWLMRKAVRENLEFLTDHHVLDKGVDRQVYQYSLLHVSQQGVAVSMSNHFNYKILKKRIMMMNKKKSSTLELGKYVMLLPAMMLAGATCTVYQADASIQQLVAKTQHTQVLLPIAEAAQDAVVADTSLNTATKGKVIVIKKTHSDSSTTAATQDNYILGPKVAAKPLIVLDGVILDQDYEISSLNPNDIESIHVLKNMEAVDEYGEKAKDGVIKITSKAAARQSAAVEGGQDKESTASPVQDSKLFTSVEVMPAPTGGLLAFRKWVANEYIIPSAAIKAKVSGRINLSFVVNKDGSLSDVQVLNDLGHGTGESAVKLLQNSPKWQPGIQNGKPVRVQYSLPIDISI